MAYIRLNEEHLSIDMIVGVEETYKPSRRIKMLNTKIKKIKKALLDFKAEHWGDMPQEDMLTLFAKSDDEKNRWDDFMKKEYLPEMKKIIKRVEAANKELQKL